MNLIEAHTYAIQEAIKDLLPGRKLDEHWARVLPETLDFAKHEIFLTLHRLYINESMEQDAARIAQTIPPREIDEIDDATLMVHSIARVCLLRTSNNPDFHALVDDHRTAIYDTTDPVVFVKPSRIWLPHSNGLARQIFRSLVERYKQIFFAQRCYQRCVDRFIQLAQKNKYIKPTFILLSDSHGMHQEQRKALHWLSATSRSIDRATGEDALQNHLAKLLALPLHIQMKKCGATGKAIKDGVIDIKRRASQYEHVYLNDECHNPEQLLNPNADESTEDPSERMIANEIPQRLLECEREIQEILGQGHPERGKRRFKVMLLRAHKPHLTSSEIAKWLKKSEPTLKVSEPTICKDKKIINRNKDRIKAILYN